MVAQKNGKLRIEKIGKIGNFALKNRKIKITFVDKDSFPAPHKGYKYV